MPPACRRGRWADRPMASLCESCEGAGTLTGVDSNGSATLYTVGGTYDLSKRTFLYAETGYVHNSSTSNIGLSDGPYGNNNYDPATNTASNSNPNYGHGQVGAFVGMMAAF